MNESHSQGLIFVKLGGSLITDKRRRAVPRRSVLSQLAHEMRMALDCAPGLRMVLAHGSGSFGHWEANQYHTHEGVRTAAEWYGFARVSAAALQLNRLVADAFINAGVPVVSLQPAASTRVRGGRIIDLALDPIQRALAADIVPLIFGDVAFDEVLGGTILSTELIFTHLAERLKPTWILLLGNTPGVLDGSGQVMPAITPEDFSAIREHVHRSGYTDVTGGMANKVQSMIDLVSQLPHLRVRIFTGLKQGNLKRAILDPAGFNEGTLIWSPESAS